MPASRPSGFGLDPDGKLWPLRKLLYRLRLAGGRGGERSRGEGTQRIFLRSWPGLGLRAALQCVRPTRILVPTHAHFSARPLPRSLVQLGATQCSFLACPLFYHHNHTPCLSTLHQPARTTLLPQGCALAKPSSGRSKPHCPTTPHLNSSINASYVRSQGWRLAPRVFFHPLDWSLLADPAEWLRRGIVYDPRVRLHECQSAVCTCICSSVHVRVRASVCRVVSVGRWKEGGWAAGIRSLKECCARIRVLGSLTPGPVHPLVDLQADRHRQPDHLPLLRVPHRCGYTPPVFYCSNVRERASFETHANALHSQCHSVSPPALTMMMSRSLTYYLPVPTQSRTHPPTHSHIPPHTHTRMHACMHTHAHDLLARTQSMAQGASPRTSSTRSGVVQR